MIQEARQKYYYPCMAKYIKIGLVIANSASKQNA